MLTRRRSGGFTLMELMIGLGIALLLLTGLIMAFTSSTKTTSDTLKRVRQTQDLRGAMAAMVRDLRRAGYWAGAASASGSGAAYSNPFAAIDASTAGCISFRYDRDGNGSAGAGENFGYRLNGGAIESMIAGDASNCAAAGNTWEALTDAKVNVVTVLAFTLGEESVSAGAGRIVVRQVAIQMEGNVAGNTATKQQLAETVRIRNDQYTP